MATHSSVLAWEIPWTEEPDKLYSPWSLKRVAHDLVTEQQQAVFSDRRLHVDLLSSLLMTKILCDQHMHGFFFFFYQISLLRKKSFGWSDSPWDVFVFK